MTDAELLDRYDELSDAAMLASAGDDRAAERAAEEAFNVFADANPRAFELWRDRYRAKIGLPTVEWKAEVIADASGEWVGNALTFTTREEAEAYARDLFSRWTLVREWRVVEVAR